MAIPDRIPNGWHIVNTHQQELSNPTAEFLKTLDSNLAYAFNITKGEIKNMGHPVATLAEWLIGKSIAEDDRQEKKEAVNLIRQERDMSVPYPLGVELIFEIARYTTPAGEGYFIFGYRNTPGIPLEDNRFMTQRIGKSNNVDKWIEEPVKIDGSAGSEFPWVARIMKATSFEWFRVRVHEGDNLDPQGGHPMPFRRAA